MKTRISLYEHLKQNYKCNIRVSIYALCEIIPSLKQSFNQLVLLYIKCCLSSHILFLSFRSRSFSFSFFFLVLFLFFGRLLQGSWLRTVLVLLGVRHDHGRVNWEVGGLLAELVPVTKVDLLDLPVEEERVGAWPLEGANHDHSVGAWLLLSGVELFVLRLVTANTDAPREALGLAAS